MIRLAFEPELMPVESTGDELPAVPAARLTADALRGRFEHDFPWTQERINETRVYDGDPRAASVLVPLVLREGGVTVLLTQRADHLSNHAGQVSFPGGRQEPDDADATATALREAQEEVSLDPTHVEVLGALPDYMTGTGFRVTPVVGLVHPPFTVKADTLEVAEIFEVPLTFLMNPAHHQVRVFRWEGGERRFFAMPYPRARAHPPADEAAVDDDALNGTGGDHFIWGATAGMLRNLYRFLVAGHAPTEIA